MVLWCWYKYQESDHSALPHALLGRVCVKLHSYTGIRPLPTGRVVMLTRSHAKVCYLARYPYICSKHTQYFTERQIQGHVPCTSWQNCVVPCYSWTLTRNLSLLTRRQGLSHVETSKPVSLYSGELTEVHRQQPPEFLECGEDTNHVKTCQNTSHTATIAATAPTKMVLKSCDGRSISFSRKRSTPFSNESVNSSLDILTMVTLSVLFTTAFSRAAATDTWNRNVFPIARRGGWFHTAQTRLMEKSTATLQAMEMPWVRIPSGFFRNRSMHSPATTTF